MRRFLLVSATGWIAVLALGVEIALPYLFRSQSSSSSLRQKMWPHYWLAYGLAILVLVHSSFVMGPAMRRGDLVGIWAATFALGLILLQLGLGLAMQSGSPFPAPTSPVAFPHHARNRRPTDYSSVEKRLRKKRLIRRETPKTAKSRETRITRPFVPPC